ncbi:hypothetical protein D3C73_1225430 [compost metagenome]
MQVVVQIGPTFLHHDAHAFQQGDQRIGFKRKALGQRVFVQRIAHQHRHQAFAIDFFQEVMQQRLVGAAKARGDAGLRQPRLCRAARVNAFEQPAFHHRAAPDGRQIGMGPGVQRTVK